MKNKKPTYKLFDNLKYILSKMWKINKWQTSLMFIKAPITVAVSLLGIILSTSVVEYAGSDKTPSQIIIMVCSISLALLIVTILNDYCTQKSYVFQMQVDNYFSVKFIETHCDKDYQIAESSAGLDRASKALGNIGMDSSPTRVISQNISALAVNLLGIISYVSILFSFSLIIPVVIIITTIASFFILKKVATWSYNNKDNWNGFDRKINYVNSNGVDFTVAKDIRLYGLGEWFADIFQDVLKGRMDWSKKQQIYNFKIDTGSAICSLVRDLVNYSLLVYIIYANNMGSSQFVFYFGIVTAFSSFVSGIATEFSNTVKSHLGICEIREFLEYPNKDNHDKGLDLPKESFSVEFKNVSFTYEGSKKPTIENFNLKVKKGEKIAIVGINGAGKTTLIKLLCGFYKPTKGEILIDGNNINQYNIDDYYSLYSAVFQDIFVLPFSIGTNITGKEDYDKKEVENILKQADLWDKFSSLPKGIDTPLVKTVQYDAVDFSGGEMQKLALARALYKNGKFLILDEPTAALDPIAESKIYQKYNEIVAEHSSIFISHRLASTRFCDRILMLENGKIIEEGTHESLMKLQKKYSKMFEVQSHYYKEGDTNEL